MLDIFLLIVFIASLVGLAVIFYRKSGELAIYAPQESNGFLDKFKPKKSVKKPILSEVFLQKILCKIRILILKTDNKTSEWMKVLREKSKTNKAKFSDNYWQKLKK